MDVRDPVPPSTPATPPEFIPLSSTGELGVMLLDTRKPWKHIHQCGETRLTAAHGLLDSLTCMGLDNASSEDLRSVAEALRLLLADAADLFHAARVSMERLGGV